MVRPAAELLPVSNFFLIILTKKFNYFTREKFTTHFDAPSTIHRVPQISGNSCETIVCQSVGDVTHRVTDFSNRSFPSPFFTVKMSRMIRLIIKKIQIIKVTLIRTLHTPLTLFNRNISRVERRDEASLR